MLNDMAPNIEPVLSARIAAALPKHLTLTLHHLSSEPTPYPELFSAPPNQSPEVTVCESHFLSASIAHHGAQVHAFALEVLAYTTETLTTLFVSKADSTGYLHLLDLPKGASSPLKTVISLFLSHLVEAKNRRDRRLVLSLFARAQDQYLFPGSIENSGKHVLDDRGLIKWWCKIFDSILRKYPTASRLAPPQLQDTSVCHRPSARAYLVVPGCDKYETQAFFPKATALSPPRWLPSNPLRSLGKPLGVPERCLIPRFPDDPKARFVIDLDDELPENGPQPQDSPIKDQHPGKWRSVRSLEQFWELMSFRQECSAGRLVGFLWAVFEPPELQDRPFDSRAKQGDELSSEQSKAEIMLPTPEASQAVVSSNRTQVRHQASPPPEPALAPFPSSQLNSFDSKSPQPKITPLTLPDTDQKIPDPILSSTTLAHNEIVLPEPAYKHSVDLLLDLDYADLALATESTHKFITGVAEAAEVSAWGVRIIGEEEIAQTSPIDIADSPPVAAIPILGAGLVRKKKRAVSEVDSTDANSGTTEDGRGAAQVLSAGLVRKKPKV